MTRNFEWNGKLRLFSNKSLKNVINDRMGNSSDLNISLCSILRAAGINAQPVIISTRSNGKISTIYPLLDRFNTTLVAVKKNDNWVFMDATYPMSEPGELPQRCLVKKGRMLTKRGSQFVEIKGKDISAEVTVIKAEILPEEAKVSGENTVLTSGLPAHSYKVQIKQKGVEAFKETLKDSKGTFLIDQIAISGFDKVGGSLKVQVHF